MKVVLYSACGFFYRARLPTYLLDFGHVVLGTVRTHVVRATNTGWFPVSFAVDRESLYQHGFTVELDRVRQLPGAPDHETVDFVVSFDPRGANLGLGEVDAFIPINVGNMIFLRKKTTKFNWSCGVNVTGATLFAFHLVVLL